MRQTPRPIMPWARISEDMTLAFHSQFYLHLWLFTDVFKGSVAKTINESVIEDDARTDETARLRMIASRI